MSLPESHVLALQSTLGSEYASFLRACESTGPTSIRINLQKWNSQLVDIDCAQSDKVLWCDNGYYLPQRPSFTHDPFFHAGWYYVQEASSMFLSHVAKTIFPKDVPLKVLDLSAAPGGKSTLLATELNDDSLLVANEVIRSRAHILAENVSKWGKANVVVTNNDPEQFEKLKGFFDVIVVDAPCSGEGLFRRDPEAAKEWSPENVNLCSSRQRRIVLDIWPALKEDGVLIYSTCTFNTQENEENLAWLKSQVSFESVELPVPPEWGVVESIGDRREAGEARTSAPASSLSSPDSRLPPIFGYRFYPHKIKGEGFFISILRKTEPQEKSLHKEKVLFAPAPSKERNEVSTWLKNAEQFDFVRRGDHILAIQKQHTEAVHRLSRTLNCVQYGIPVADTGKGMKPLHELALSVHLNKDAFHQTELSKEDALKFLAKVDFKVESGHKGISLMTYQGAPLGWMNLLGNRANNLYPKEWRIRRL